LWGPGIFSVSGYVEESNFHNGYGGNKEQPPEASKKSDEEVVYIGSFAGIWGYCLTDNLKHLCFLPDPDHPLRKLRFAYVMLTEEESLPESFLQLIELLGVQRENFLRITGTCQFRKIWLPEQCFFCVQGGDIHLTGKRQYTVEYTRLIQKIKDCVPSASNIPEKVYFTRTAMKKNNRDYGEKSIEKTFRKT